MQAGHSSRITHHASRINPMPPLPLISAASAHPTAQIILAVLGGLLVALLVLAVTGRFSPTPEEREAARQLSEAEATRLKQQALEDAARAAEHEQAAAARQAELEAHSAAHPPTVRGGLIKAGAIILALALMVAMLLGIGTIEKLMIAAGIVVFVIGWCLPETVSKTDKE
jgi:Flp pilus assembly protein TadB